MPVEIVSFIAKNFNNVYGSPYSSSFYSESGQSWDYTPKNQIRVADHWNFWSRDYSDPTSEMEQHAKTNIPVMNNDKWTVAKKNDKGIYEVIMSLDKKEFSKKNYNQKYDLLASKKPNEILLRLEDKKRMAVSKSKQDERAEKIKKEKLWITYDRKYTERQSARKFVTIEEKNQIGLLISETAQFISIRQKPKGSLFKYKKSTLSNYKEHTRKPK